jgi:hypothetical protein
VCFISAGSWHHAEPLHHYLKDSALQVIPLRSPTLKREIVLMRRNEVARSVWADHCFTELRNDLKEVNHWF